MNKPKSSGKKTESIGARIPTELADKLREEAASREWSVSQLVAKILTVWDSGRKK